MAPSPIKVSQLNAYIKRVLRSDPVLGNVSVVGEISNYTLHGSGHVYFSLKDDLAKINCFLPADIFAGVRFDLNDGLEVVASGYVNVYEKGGSYSLNVRNIALHGERSPVTAFDQLKEKLAAEGLFDKKYKKPLPAFPKRIAIVTSATGAAVHDMLKIITAKNRYVDIFIYPTLVQGPEAAGEIARGIAYINRERSDTDIIIIGRGGGSAEELSAFNDEMLARAVFASEIPVISAVGHETDVTISDFAADVRAETPTAAAQMAVPDISDVRAALTGFLEIMTSALTDKSERLTLRMNACNVDRMHAALVRRISHETIRTKHAAKELDIYMRKCVEKRRHLAERRIAEIEALNPHRVLERGYAALLDDDGRPVVSAHLLREGMKLRAILHDGKAQVTVDQVTLDAQSQ